MASCNVNSVSFQREDGELEVIEKYNSLMVASLGEESIYTRAKETLFHQFEDLQLTEKEKAGFVVEFISGVATELSKSAMSLALPWAQSERDGGYSLAKVKAETLNTQTTQQKIEEEICLLQKEDELKCITIEATSAQSIRENGRVSTYKLDDNGNESCHALTLEQEGLKYFQTRQVEADSYRIFADSYRKSGVVQIGTDPIDLVEKGITGTTHDESGELAGYTAQQIANAERQRIAYEDSKVNHAANSSASMIGQMLSAEVAPADTDVQRWRDAVDRLLTVYQSTDLECDPAKVCPPDYVPVVQ